MQVPCVRVEREAGEQTRRRLDAADLVDRSAEIVVEEGWLYVPVTDPGAVPGEYEVVEREVPARETPTTPDDLLGFEPSYERLGDIVVLHEDDAERAREVAAAVMDSDVRAKTVVNRASKVKGEERVRDWEVLAGDGTETVHREYGHEFLVDIARVYFSPRLATERHRVVEQVRAGERAFDMFAGVGPFVVPFASAGATAVGTDVNEAAVDYLVENARRNGHAVRRGAAGEVAPGGDDPPVTAVHGDVREAAVPYEGWADRVVMNLPHSADEFLDAAVALAADECVVHYYDIQHEDDPFGPGEAAVRAAAGDRYDATVRNRRVVRSYAPHELNVALDVELSRRP
ncbi:MAG: class I SAM-dependent methyltransferase family protein [Halobacteriaceae archaeon]